MIRADIRTIPSRKMRYQTAGDYATNRGKTEIRVAAMNDERHEMCLALHEFVEAMLCKHDGIPDHEIDKWDMGYDGIEPGDDPECPYAKQHAFALKVEAMMAEYLGIDWEAYEQELERVANACPDN